MAGEAEEVGGMMALVELLRGTFRGVTGWKDACEAGAPVPHTGGCKGVNCASVRVTTLRVGGRGAVTCLEEPWTGDAARLAGLGILPGVRVQVVQRYPAYILQLGRTQIALDADLAGRVRVRAE
jgi:Fe2+ transport system protein FeoA